jgi:glutamyl-tRNA reductase
MALIVLGLSHHTAPLPARERVAYSPEQTVEALRELKTKHAVPQAILLSTCNRTELYALVGNVELALPDLRQRLFFERLGEQNGEPAMLYEWQNEKAVRHFFRVACGLDSMVVGENEILGQVRSAVELSRTAETVGTVFQRLADRAFHLGRRARAETEIGAGAVSIAYAAIELAEKVYQNLEGRGVLLVGAGEHGRLCAEHLLSRKVAPLLIANRTPEKAEALAARLGGETVAFDRIGDVLDQIDVVVSTTSAPGTIIGYDLVRHALRRRAGRSLVMLDVAVPRDIDTAVARLPNTFLFDMDAIREIVEQNLARRRADAPAVESMVDAEVERFMGWWDGLGTGPVIRDLHRRFDAIRIQEIARNAKRFAAEDREQLEVFSSALVRKLLMGVVMEIKHYRTDDPVQVERLATLRELFDLDAPDPEEDEAET